MLADAELKLVYNEVKNGEISLQIRNKRRFTLRQVTLSLEANETKLEPLVLNNIEPESIQEITIKLPQVKRSKATNLKGFIEFVTHYGFKSKIPVSLIVKN